jgi:protein-disulfide isomerase
MVVHAVNVTALVVLIVVAVRNRKEFLRRETSSLGERVYFVTGGVLLSFLIFSASGMWEKHLSLKTAQARYDAVAEDIVVILARLNASPVYEIPISEKDPVFGSPSAPFPIVLFTDFQCPVCPRTEQALLALVSANRDLLRLVYKNYPLSTDCNQFIATNLHPMACQAARAAAAAFLLGGNTFFFAYAQMMFHSQKELRNAPWLEFADKLRLDRDKFEDLLKDGSNAAARVQHDIELGIRLGLTSTPQMFFEKRKLPDKLKPELLIQIMEYLIRSNHPGRQDVKLKVQ